MVTLMNVLLCLVPAAWFLTRGDDVPAPHPGRPRRRDDPQRRAHRRSPVAPRQAGAVERP